MLKKAVINLLLMAVIAAAAEGGRTGMSFLKIAPDARSAAMAGTGVALYTDASAGYWNPAGLAGTEKESIVLTHSQWIENISHEFASVQLFRGRHNIAVTLNMVNIPGIEIRGSSPTAKPDGEISAQNLYLGASWALAWNDNLLIGAGLKYFYEKYYLEAANGFALDAGIIYKELFPQLDWGFSVQNLGSMQKLARESTNLPLMVNSGFTYRLSNIIPLFQPLLLLDAVFVSQENIQIRFGIEAPVWKILELRAGYVAGNDARSWSGGLGINFNNYLIDYAFVPFDYDLGNAHRFTVRYLF